jgi:hypothetical protein
MARPALEAVALVDVWHPINVTVPELDGKEATAKFVSDIEAHSLELILV